MDDKWKSQMRKGFIELCVFVFVGTKGSAYGLEMLDGLRNLGLELAEGTLYPLLARMLGEGSLTAEWETPETGHPRKFYRVSEAGGERLLAMEEEFEQQQRVYRAIKGGL
jgi:PadR family transcriptional regulator, regulatory protein PadR